MTQCDMILLYMQTEGAITPLDAMREFGCMRLGARIADLKDKGYTIVSGRETAKNRYGKKVSYARYHLA